MPNWSDLSPVEKKEAIEAYCTKEMSASEKAMTLSDCGVIGANRNMVVGFINRSMPDWMIGRLKSRPAGAPRRDKGTTRPRKPETYLTGNTDGSGPKGSIKKAPAPDQVAANPKPLMELGPNQCRWPLWDDENPERKYCGDPVMEGESYCAHHKLKATNLIHQEQVRRRLG